MRLSFGILIASFLIAFTCLIVWAIHTDRDFRDACASRGGVIIDAGYSMTCVDPGVLR